MLAAARKNQRLISRAARLGLHTLPPSSLRDNRLGELNDPPRGGAQPGRTDRLGVGIMAQSSARLDQFDPIAREEERRTAAAAASLLQPDAVAVGSKEENERSGKRIFVSALLYYARVYRARALALA